MTKVKICGINDPAAFDAAVEAGADWLGFVFFPPSPRYVTPEAAAALSARSPGGPPRVGLFVNPTAAEIEETLASVSLDVLQIYGSTDHLGSFSRRFGLSVWHAVGVSHTADLPTTSGAENALVIEAKPPRDADRPGGNGLSFDWSILQGWRAPSPWILAGGLTVQNVRSAVQATGADAVDVSSGVEQARGIKSPAMIQDFIQAAKSLPR